VKNLEKEELMTVEGGAFVLLGVTVTGKLIAKAAAIGAASYGAGSACGKAYSHYTNSK